MYRKASGERLPFANPALKDDKRSNFLPVKPYLCTPVAKPLYPTGYTFKI